MQPKSLNPAFPMQIQGLWNGTPVTEADRIELIVEPGPVSWCLKVDAPFYGDPPPHAPAGPTWALWEHEVVEWFIAGPGEEYLEIELGPHGHHLALQLSGIRQVRERELPLSFEAELRGNRWRGEASFPIAWLPEGPWRVNAYGIHGVGSERTYLAAYPTGGEAPDFHQLDSFQALSPDPSGVT